MPPPLSEDLIPEPCILFRGPTAEDSTITSF